MTITNRTAFAWGAAAGAGLMMAGAAVGGRVWAQDKATIAPLRLDAPLSPESQARMTAAFGAQEKPLVDVEMQMSNEYLAVRKGLKIYLYKIDGKYNYTTFTVGEERKR